MIAHGTPAKDQANPPSPAPHEHNATYDDHELPAAVEAVLLAMDRPLTPARLAAATGIADTDDASAADRVAAIIDALNADYDATGRAFRIEKLAGGYRVLTRQRFAAAVAAVHGMQASTRLSRAAIETLSIVAYRQPITRADIEAIRGVACGEVLRGLLEKKLVTIAGRAEELGRPMLYGTTPRFLEAFGLASLKDLPAVNDGAPDLAAALRQTDDSHHADPETRNADHDDAEQPEHQPAPAPETDA